MCAPSIHRHITNLPLHQIFTTRDMLAYGSRSAVDSTLYRMVQASFIYRVARGVFVRHGSRIPSIVEIARAKAMAFKSNLQEVPNQADVERGVHKKHATICLLKQTHDSSFGTVRGRVFLKAVGPRKWNLLNTDVGQKIFTMWTWGSTPCELADLNPIFRRFGHYERQVFWKFSSMMPAWLSDLMRLKYAPPTGFRAWSY